MKRHILIITVFGISIACFAALAQFEDSQPVNPATQSGVVTPTQPASVLVQSSASPPTPSTATPVESKKIKTATPMEFTPYPVAVTPGFSYSAGTRGSVGQALIILTNPATSETLGMIREDVGVMTRILQKEISKEFPDSHSDSMFSDPMSQYGVWPGGLPNAHLAVQSIYVEGHGVMFLTNVGFPLQAPPDWGTETTASGDSTWENTRREMYGQEEPKTKEEYDPKKLERLQEVLVKTLRHASNIRNLSSDMMVSVIVSSTDASQVAGTMFYRSSADLNVLERIARRSTGVTNASPTFSTTLAVHARKSDIDQFAQEQLSFDAFKQKATILIY